MGLESCADGGGKNGARWLYGRCAIAARHSSLSPLGLSIRALHAIRSGEDGAIGKLLDDGGGDPDFASDVAKRAASIACDRDATVEALRELDGAALLPADGDKRRRGGRASRPTRASSFDYTPHVRKYNRKSPAGSSEDAKYAAGDAGGSSSEVKMASATVVHKKDDSAQPKKRKRGPGRPRKDGQDPPAKRGRGRPRKDASGGGDSNKKVKPPRKKEPPPTPAELYERIQKSRDRLFFVAYRQDEDDDRSSPRKAGGSGRKTPPSAEKKGKAGRKHWYLVRVDVDTAERQLDMRPSESGEYYVEVRLMYCARGQVSARALRKKAF